MPVFLTLLLIIVAFFAGGVTYKLLAKKPEASLVSDATSAFIAYAKQLKLNTNDFTSCLTSEKYAQAIKTDMELGRSLQVRATPTFFINGRILVGSQPYSVFKELLEQELSSRRTSLPVEAASTPARTTIAKGTLPILGKNSAPVTIVEFSDFQCPFCRSFFMNTYPKLKKDYIDSGKARLLFRHFPIPATHPNAPKAHEASECANEQGKFWEYHDLLFREQQIWSTLPLTTAQGV